jgi:CRP/FNR family transcriptional regulator
VELFAEGESVRGIHILCSGHIKLTINSADGKTLILRIASPGEVLGLHNCISGLAHDMSAITVQPSQLTFVRRADVLRFLQEHGDACYQAAEQLSRTCHTVLDLIRSLGLSQSVEEKLACLLLEFASEGEDTAEGVRVELGLTHEEMGEMIGTSRETVTRVLSRFRRRQLAKLSRSTLLIQNKQELERMVGLVLPAASLTPVASLNHRHVPEIAIRSQHRSRAGFDAMGSPYRVLTKMSQRPS